MLGDLGFLVVGKPGEQADLAEHLEAPRQLAAAHGLRVGLVALDGVRGVLRLGDADPGALQRSKEVHAHHRIGEVVLHQVGQEVAQLVAQVARLEAVEHAARRRRARHVGHGELAHLLVDDGDHARRRHGGVDHEIEDAPPLQRRAFDPAEDRDARLHQRAVRDHHRLPVARLDQRRAPADVAHAADQVVDAHPVADPHRVVELDGQPAEQVAERVLHREGEHRGQDCRGGDEAGEIDAGAAQLHETVDHVRDDDRQVLDDARQVPAEERQQQPEHAEAEQADERDRRDDAEHRVDRFRSAREVERIDGPGGGLADDPEQEQPQRVDEHPALVPARAQQQDRQHRRDDRHPEDVRAPEPGRQIGGFHGCYRQSTCWDSWGRRRLPARPRRCSASGP